MAKTKTGHAIRRARRRGAQLKQLDQFIARALLKSSDTALALAADDSLPRAVVTCDYGAPAVSAWK